MPILGSPEVLIWELPVVIFMVWAMDKYLDVNCSSIDAAKKVLHPKILKNKANMGC